MKSDRRERRSTTSSGGLTYSLLRSTETMAWVVDCFTWTSLKGLWLILSHSFRPSFIYQLTLFSILHFLFSLCLVCALAFFLNSPYTPHLFPFESHYPVYHPLYNVQDQLFKSSMTRIWPSCLVYHINSPWLWRLFLENQTFWWSDSGKDYLFLRKHASNVCSYVSCLILWCLFICNLS